MSTFKKCVAAFGLAVVSLVFLSPVQAEADPVRITVSFTVAGDTRLDPDHASATGAGSFSVLTTLPPDSRVTDFGGFGATPVSFSWLGTTWTDADADLVQLGFDVNGQLNFWTLGGAAAGIELVRSDVSTDFSAGFCGFCAPSIALSFIYTTPRSEQLGIFTGSITSMAITQDGEPIATPEPISMVLAGTGLAGIWARKRLTRRREA